MRELQKALAFLGIALLLTAALVPAAASLQAVPAVSPSPLPAPAPLAPLRAGNPPLPHSPDTLPSALQRAPPSLPSCD